MGLWGRVEVMQRLPLSEQRSESQRLGWDRELHSLGVHGQSQVTASHLANLSLYCLPLNTETYLYF